MSLEGPQLRFVRVEEPLDPLARALDLARQVEDLLDIVPPSTRAGSTHSTRMARAMAASLIDELEALVRGAAKKDVASG